MNPLVLPYHNNFYDHYLYFVWLGGKIEEVQRMSYINLWSQITFKAAVEPLLLLREEYLKKL